MAASGPRPPRTRTTRGPSIRPVYETFEPKSEMKEKEEAYFLHIYLPGFVKEKIKINFVGSSRVVRVAGERPLGGNRISNFEQAYPVPENCEVGKLQGKYELGTLIITMPKKPIISQVSPKAKVETTPRIGPTPLISSPKKSVPDQLPKPKEVVAKEAMPPKSPIISRMEQVEKSYGDKTRPQHVQEETMVKSTAIASTPRKETGKSQKGHEEIEPKPTSTMGFGKQIEYKNEEANKQNDITTYIEKVKEKQNKDREYEKLHERRKQDQKYVDHNVVLKEREIKTTRPKETVSSSTPPKAHQKGKETSTTIIDKGKRRTEEDEIYTIGKGIKEVVASASEVVTKIGEGNLDDEEKPLVANMGAAILVIVALGAYVTYKFTSASSRA
ncbi:Protein RESTRICTED TEV MOVEMENT 2 [Glycine soja]